MRRRFLSLLLLLLTALGCWGTHAYLVVFRPAGINLLRGMRLDRHLQIIGIREKDASGQLSRGYQAGLREGDRIMAVLDTSGERHEVHSAPELSQAAERLRSSRPFTRLLVQRQQGATTEEIEVALTSPVGFTAGRAVMIGLDLVLPFIAIATAALVGLLRPQNSNAFLASLLFLSLALVFPLQVLFFPGGIREIAVLYQFSGRIFFGFLFMLFFLRFPTPSAIDRRVPWLKTLFLAISTLVWAYTLINLWLGQEPLGRLPARGVPLPDPFLLFSLAMLTIGLLSLIVTTIRTKTKDEKRRLAILLWGACLGLLPIAWFSVRALFWPPGPPPIWGIAISGGLVMFFPLSFIYVVVKHRVLGIRLILRRGLQYALVSRGFLVVEGSLIFLAIFFVAGPLFPRVFPSADMPAVVVSTAVITAGAVMGLRKLNRTVMPAIDRAFFREAYDAHHILTDLSRTVRRLAVQPDKLIETVTSKISDSLLPDQVALFVREAQANRPPSGGALPAGVEGSNSEGSFLYRCRGIRVRPDGASNSRLLLNSASLTLTGDSMILEHLQGLGGEEASTVEVYLDDPKSWVRPIAEASPDDPALQEERQLLLQLNTKLIVPFASKDQILGFISLGEKLSEEAYSRDDKEMLLTVAEQTAIALEYAQLISQVADQEKFQREVEIAKDVQTHLFPQSLPPLQSLDYSGICQAAGGVGGDYYDFLLLSPSQLGIALGDISGKGISAALLMASLQALLRSHAPALQQAVDQVVARINRLMCSSTNSNQYATFFYGLYDDHHRTLTYVNAGHNPPFLVRTAPRSQGVSPPFSSTRSSGSEPSEALGQASSRLCLGGTVIGVFPDAEYQQATISLEAGDILVIFSDGVSEAANAQREEFGEARIESLVRQNPGLSAMDLQRCVLSDLGRFVGDTPQHDDQTLLIAKVL